MLEPRPGRRTRPRQARWGQDTKMVLDRLRARSRCHHVHGASQACSGYAWERPSSVFSLLFFYSSTLRALTRLAWIPRGLVGTRRGRDGSVNARADDLAPFLCLGPNAPVAATHGVQAAVRAPRLASVASRLARGRIGPDRAQSGPPPRAVGRRPGLPARLAAVVETSHHVSAPLSGRDRVRRPSAPAGLRSRAARAKIRIFWHTPAASAAGP